MKILGKIIIVAFFVGGLVFSRETNGKTRIERKDTQVKSEHYWVKDHSSNNDEQIDRKRSNKRRRKIRKPIKGLR